MQLITNILLCSLVFLPNVVLAQKNDINKNLPIEVKNIIVDTSLSKKKSNDMINAAKNFYSFWDTGNEKFAKVSIDENFMDHMLPKGRPQGPSGPIFASKNFRKAVPDLHCEIQELLLVGDRVIARLSFTGKFTGVFMDKKGSGGPVNFNAIDILRIKNGKITDNWHLEDNLTLMQQLGVVSN